MSRPAPPPPHAPANADDALFLALGHALPLPCVVALPADGRMLFANLALGRLMAMEAHYLVGDRLDRLFFDEDDAARLRAQMMTGQLPAQLPVTLRSHAGQPIAASLCPATVALGSDTLALLFFLPLAEQSDSILPSALSALRQGLPAGSETDAHLQALLEALTQTP